MVIILPNAELRFAIRVGEVDSTKNFQLGVAPPFFFYIGIIIGVSAIDDPIDKAANLLVNADKALYFAKNNGKS